MLVFLSLLNELQILGLISNNLAHVLIAKHGSTRLSKLCNQLFVLLDHVLSILLSHAMCLCGLKHAHLLVELCVVHSDLRVLTFKPIILFLKMVE